MSGTRRILVDAASAAAHLRRAYGLTIAPATIRSWAKRGLITRHEPDRFRARFDLDEIDAQGRERVAERDVAK